MNKRVTKILTKSVVHVQALLPPHFPVKMKKRNDYARKAGKFKCSTQTLISALTVSTESGVVVNIGWFAPSSVSTGLASLHVSGDFTRHSGTAGVVGLADSSSSELPIVSTPSVSKKSGSTNSSSSLNVFLRIEMGIESNSTKTKLRAFTT